jgi:hypothetical protein
VKKKIKLRKTKIQSQGHKTLMYGTWMHAWPKVKIYNKAKKKKTKPWKVENLFTRTWNPCVGKIGQNS